MIALYPTRCNICGGPVKLVSNDRVYSPEYAREHPDKVYLCLRCGAYVGVHWHTHRAKGILADKHMRKARMFCHDLFDSFWHGKRHAQKKRQKAYIYNDGDLARIRVDVMDNRKLLVSDDGGAAKHEELTIEEVKKVCRRYGLRYETIDDDLTMPLCCDMYCVVDKKDFYLAVWHVIRAIHDAHDMVEEKMAEEKKEVKS